MLNLSTLLTASSRIFVTPAYLIPDVGAMLAKLVPNWQIILDQLDERERAALVTLVNQGWYSDHEFTIPQLFSMVNAIEEGLVKDVNEVLCDWYEERLRQIELDLSARHPHRARFFRDAFEAHKEEKYTLSVPVFLKQADGIFYELTGHQLYSRRKDKGIQKLTASLGSEAVTSGRASVVHVLSQPLPISSSVSERRRAPDLLNRHAVLHGEDLNYDTRTQSCRAISLLNCVSWAFCKRPIGAAYTEIIDTV